MYSNLYTVIYILLISYSLAISKCRHSDSDCHFKNKINPVYFKEECRVNTQTGKELCITTNLNAKKQPSVCTVDEASNTLICIGNKGSINEGYTSKTNLNTGDRVITSPITSFEIDYLHCKLDSENYDSICSLKYIQFTNIVAGAYVSED